MKPNTLAILLAFAMLFGPLPALAASSSSAGTRYFVPTTKSFWKGAFGVRHSFADGFTTTLSDFQVKVAKFAGLKPAPVRSFNVLAETDAEEVSSAASPSEPVGWGVVATRNKVSLSVASGSGVTIAVLDTGIEQDHPDLAGRIVGCADYTVAEGVPDKEACADENGHGTHVAGILAADGGASGITGVAPAADLLISKVCNTEGICFSDDIAVALRAVVDAGANIVVFGMGGERGSSLMSDAIGYAVEEGVLLIAAAGNDGPYEDSLDWPARDARVLAVGALEPDGAVAEFSSRGINTDTDEDSIEDGDIEFAAPGVSIESTNRLHGYAVLSGTSMAAPHVAGLAALLWQTEEEHPAEATRLLLHKYAASVGDPADINASGWGFPSFVQ